MSALRKWFPYRRPVVSAQARLFCFPYAGGSAAAFRTWGEQLAPTFEVCAVEPPGRSSRFADVPFRRIEAYVDALVPLVGELADRPFAFFGHSLGAKVAFELAQRLQRARGPRPIAVAFSGHGLRDVREPDIHALPTPQLLERLRRYDGTPPELLDNAELMDLVLPTLRADFESVASHEYDLSTQLECPVLALGGRGDTESPEESLAAWGDHTASRFQLRMFDGKHFFLRDSEKAVLEAVRTFVEDALRQHPSM